MGPKGGKKIAPSLQPSPLPCTANENIWEEMSIILPLEPKAPGVVIILTSCLRVLLLEN